MSRYLICLPTYDERPNIGPMIDALARVRQVDDLEGDVLVIDDASPDGTGRIAESMRPTRDWLHVLHRPGKEGLGRAYVAGFRWALERDYAYVIEIDCDFSHDPAAIPGLLRAAIAGADLVLGSRYVPGGEVSGWGVVRRFVSAGGCLYARTVLGLPIRDLTGGFKCFRREVIASIDLDAITAHGYAFQIETTYRAIRRGYRVVEVPIRFRDRTAGGSKMSREIVVEAARRVLELRVASLLRRV